MWLVDLTNKVFGRLTVKEYLGSSRWRCECSCGSSHNAQATHLNGGGIRSCGCLADEQRAVHNAIRLLEGIVNTPQRFIDQIEFGGGCWIWRGDYFRKGYGKFKGPGPEHRTLQAHRASYELFIGPIPAGMLVCHECDNTTCVRPDHFFLGTHKDNIQDSIAKGRRSSVGIKNPKAVLTEKQVATVLDAQGSDARRLAAELKVSATTIRNIWRGKTWKHLRAQTFEPVEA